MCSKKVEFMYQKWIFMGMVKALVGSVLNKINNLYLNTEVLDIPFLE